MKKQEEDKAVKEKELEIQRIIEEERKAEQRSRSLKNAYISISVFVIGLVGFISYKIHLKNKDSVKKLD